jgi:mannose-6-phosphate isomerase-like protein (cupin superfamily)
MSEKIFGAHFIENKVSVVESCPDDLYFFRAFVGKQTIRVEQGDGLFTLNEDIKEASFRRGPIDLESLHFSVLVRGYSAPDKRVSLRERTYLPYVNGCSTRQIIPPERPGDPTLQMLYLPPHSSEQAHHIHSTARVVYVLKGSGTCVVGMEKSIRKTALKSGMVCILERMCPHHFETDESELLVLPVHVWSSVGGSEYNHPMYNGTFLLNQGT